MYFESKNSQNSCTYNGPMATVAVVTAAVVVTAVVVVIAVAADVAHAVVGISSNWGHS